MPEDTPPSRHATVVARSLLVTAETVGFATFVHTQAGGSRPGVLQTAAVAAAVLAGALALLSKRARLGPIAVAVVGAQVLLHEAFSLTTATPAGMDSSMSSMAAMSPTGPGLSAPDLSALLVSPGWHMVLTHLVIALLTVLVLGCQQVALTALVAGVRLWNRAGPVPLESPRPRPTWQRQLGARPALFSVAPRRGPPLGILLTP